LVSSELMLDNNAKTSILVSMFKSKVQSNESILMRAEHTEQSSLRLGGKIRNALLLTTKTENLEVLGRDRYALSIY
jgi:starvation-inducible outer membrane lipoprotein